MWAFGNDPWNRRSNGLQSPKSPEGGARAAYVFGAGMTILLASLRTRLLGWPLHPAGYVVGCSFGLYLPVESDIGGL